MRHVVDRKERKKVVGINVGFLTPVVGVFCLLGTVVAQNRILFEKIEGVGDGVRSCQ